MKSLLEQFKAGEIAAKNDVTPEQLNRLLKWAAPEYHVVASGSATFYWIRDGDGVWVSTDKFMMNSVPASQLLAELDALETPAPEPEPEFKWGEEVEVCDTIGTLWVKCLFIGVHPNKHVEYKYITVTENEQCSRWRYCRRPVPTITITIAEAKTYAAAVMGTTADKIEIK